jgi:hypothetical protein
MTDLHDPLNTLSGTTALSRSPGSVAPVGTDGDRQCGRCREFFADDATRGLSERSAWWLCAPCRAILLPRTVATERSRGGEAPVGRP